MRSREYRHRDPGHAGQLSSIVRQIDLPYMRSSTNVNGPRGPGHPALRHAPDVVRIDVKSDTLMPDRRCAVRSTRAQRLGQNDGYAAMEYSGWL